MIDIGRIGIWTGALDGHPAGAVREVAAEIDQAGWPTLLAADAALPRAGWSELAGALL